MLSRRRLLVAAGASLAGRAAGVLAGAPPTPAQVLGPFFPRRRRADEDADLTRVDGRAGRAHGEVIEVHGRVQDAAGRPLPGARIDVWQANAWGRYDHERDADSPRPLDPNFQGWARLTAGADGAYRIVTVKPGSYPGDDAGWIRPPHVHFQVSHPAHAPLVTQMYFADEPLNAQDLLWRALAVDDRRRVTVALASGAGRFELTLRPAR